MKKKILNVNDVVAVITVVILTAFMVAPAHAQTANQPSPNTQFLQTIMDIVTLFSKPGATQPEIKISPLPEGTVINEKGQLVTVTPAPIDNRDKTTGQPIADRPNFVYYCQGNTQWARICDLGGSGCGPTSVAMVLSSFGLNFDPPAVDAVFQQKGWRRCGDSPSFMTPALTSDWLPSLGFRVSGNLVQGTVLDLVEAQKYIQAGAVIVASSREFPCANCKPGKLTVDHVFTVDNVDAKLATVSVRDPNNCSYADGNDENQTPARRYFNVTAFPWLYAYAILKAPVPTP